MRIDIATLFPDMCEAVLSTSIIGRARKAGFIEVYCHNIRDFSKISTKGSMLRLMAAETEC